MCHIWIELVDIQVGPAVEWLALVRRNLMFGVIEIFCIECGMSVEVNLMFP